MSPPAIARALAGIAIGVRRTGPTPRQWVEALAVVASAPVIPGFYRLVDLEPGRARITIHRLPRET